MKCRKCDESSVAVAAEALKNGKIVIIPTDTVYGFSGMAGTDAEIRRIKGREAYKPFIRLIAKPEDIRLYTDDAVPEELLGLWPGAVTVIVNNKNALSEGTSEDCRDRTVALRCPGDLWLRNVIEAAGGFIYSTSVNRSGCPVLSDISAIEAEFQNDVAVIVDDGDKKNALPSTIVSCTDGKCVVIRQGSVAIPDSIRQGVV